MFSDSTNYYFVYGLYIKSSIPFPGLPSKKSKPDVIIYFNNFDCLTDNFKENKLGNYTRVRASFDRNDIFWQDICLCSVRKGKEIIINPSTGLDESFIRTIIFGIGLAILLYQRGMLVLHANAVSIGGKAVAFIGPPGIGKSTTSIFLHNKGHNLLSDDILAIKVTENDNPLVFPGFNTLKFWPEVIEILGENPKTMPKVNSYYKKHFYNVINNFNQEPIPLKSIYLIEEGEKTAIIDMSIQESLVELIKSSYCARMFDNDKLFLNLKQSAKIVEEVPVKTLRVKKSFEDIPKLVEILEDDFL